MINILMLTFIKLTQAVLKLMGLLQPSLAAVARSLRGLKNKTAEIGRVWMSSRHSSILPVARRITLRLQPVATNILCALPGTDSRWTVAT